MSEELMAGTGKHALYVFYDVVDTVGYATSDTTTLLVVSYWELL